jgi:rod shape-determining protein MreD
LSFQSKSPPSIAIFDPEWWKIAVTVFVALLVQTTLLPQLAVHDGVVSLPLLLVLWYAMNAGPARGALFGLIIGACEDALAVTGAAWTFADAAAGAFAGAVARTLPSDSAFIAAPVVIPLTIARYVVFLSVLHIEHGTFVSPHWGAALTQSGLNAVVALLALTIAARYDFSYVGR